MADLSDLEKRLQRLEDLESIRRLRTEYGDVLDRLYAAGGQGGEGKLQHLFTEDAEWDGGTAGNVKGAIAIEEHFIRIAQKIKFSLHFHMGHTIDLEPGADEGSGWSYMLAPATIGGQAILIGGREFDRYRRVGGRWQFSYLRAEIEFRTPWDEAWVRKRFIY